MTAGPLSSVLLAAIAAAALGARCDVSHDPFCDSNCNCSAFCDGACSINATKHSTHTMYRMTPPDVLSLSDKNTGNAAGDAWFMVQRRLVAAQCRANPNPLSCGTVLEPTSDVVVQVEVETDGLWGPYQQCNPVNASDPRGAWQCKQYEAPGSPALPDKCMYIAQESCNLWDGDSDHIADVDLAGCCAAASTYNSSVCVNGSVCGWHYVRATRECTLYTHGMQWNLSRTDHGCVLAYGAGSQPPVPAPPTKACTCPRSLRAVGRQAEPGNGTWFSFPSAGRCEGDHSPGDGSGCAWRVSNQTSKVDAQCVYEQLDAAIESSDPGCFSTCPHTPAGKVNGTTGCYVQCFAQALAATSSHQAVLSAWQGALNNGVCPQV